MDVGVRSGKNSQYIGLFRQAEAISVAPIPLTYVRYDNLICLPTALHTEFIS